MHTLTHTDMPAVGRHPQRGHNLFKQDLQIVGLPSCDGYWSINSLVDWSHVAPPACHQGDVPPPRERVDLTDWKKMSSDDSESWISTGLPTRRAEQGFTVFWVVFAPFCSSFSPLTVPHPPVQPMSFNTGQNLENGKNYMVKKAEHKRWV